MATKKQRRRREKEKRHDYEVVYLDHEGNEVEPEPSVSPSNGRGGASPKSGGGRGQKAGTAGRRGRAPQPPSWRRVAKRGAMFAPLFLITVLLIGGKRMNVAAAVVQTAVLLVLFVPFSYFLDSVMWKSFQRRQAGSAKR